VPKRNSPQNLTSFQIHKNGSAVDGVSYPTLEQASAALEKAAQRGEVTQVDRLDQGRAALYVGRMPKRVQPLEKA